MQQMVLGDCAGHRAAGCATVLTPLRLCNCCRRVRGGNGDLWSQRVESTWAAYVPSGLWRGGGLMTAAVKAVVVDPFVSRQRSAAVLISTRSTLRRVTPRGR